MLRYGKHLLWIVVAGLLASALWMANVEITYQRNVRHIPTNFRQRHNNPPNRWRA